MRRRKQLAFALLEENSAKVFGGSYLKNSNAKVARPISRSRPMHLVIRSSLARGDRSLLKSARRIADIVIAQGQKHHVKVYRYSNAGNHLHLMILPRDRDAYNGFVRSITGLIARVVLAVERGNAKGLKFWDARPFTRIVAWGRDYNRVAEYLLKNTLEAIGFQPYERRKNTSIERRSLKKAAANSS